MPITQDRMLTLIKAARDYKDALDSVRLYIKRQCKANREGKASAQESLDYIELISDPVGLLRDPLNSPATIAVEESHFKTMGARNRANAKWNEQNRRNQGIKARNKNQNLGLERREIELAEPFHSTAPESIERRGEYKGSINDQIEAEEAGQSLYIKPRKHRDKRNEPKTIGPANAPGLYDNDEPDGAAIIGSSGRSEEEILAAIAADEERDKNLEKWNELQKKEGQ